MEFTRRLSLKLVTPIVLVILLAGLLQMASAQSLGEQPKWEVGDRWTYRRGSGPELTYTILKASSDGYSFQVREGSGNNTVSAENLHFLYFQWPLELGKQWMDKVSQQISGRTLTFSVTHTVSRQEAVEVPGGTFDAVRISGRHCNDTLGGCGDFALWYAAKARFGVKIAWSGQYWEPSLRGASQVLVSYELRNP